MRATVKTQATLALLLTLSSAPLMADDGDTANNAAAGSQVIQPEVVRQEVDIAAIDTENFEFGIFAGLMSVEDFGTNAIVGARLAYHISEGLFVEAAYAQTDTEETSFERLSGAAQLLDDDERTLTYMNISLGYNLLLGEVFLGSKRAYNTALYVIGGIGSTEFAGDNRSTMNFGAGYRFLLTDWMAIHLDARDHIFDIDVTGEDRTTNNLEFTGGVSLFF
ncbi:MAG: outer membrane beta-barrel domain-containing protein [Gammaproteobacteria bacterium]|nr:outer membrane beta-barrel domain-containing protein [Gammaproteobacteria bacterium]